MKRPNRATVVAVVLMLVGALAPSAVRASTTAEYLAQTHGGTPSDYAMIQQVAIPDPFRQDLFPTVYDWAEKWENAQTGHIYSVHYVGGQPVGPEDYEQYVESYEATLTPLQRKADRALLRWIGDKWPNLSPLPVAIWLNVDTRVAVSQVLQANPELAVLGLTGSRVADDEADPLLADRFYEQYSSALQQLYTAAEQEMATQLLAWGESPGYGSIAAPVLFADVSRSGLDAVAALDDVVHLGYDGTGWSQQLASAGPAVSANWTTGTGDLGTGVRVGVVEYENVNPSKPGLGGGVVVGQSCLHGSRESTTMPCPYYGVDHASWVAAAIASRSTSQPGIAPRALIVSSATGKLKESDFRDSAFIKAADWAVRNGNIKILNASICQDYATGDENARRYFDSVAYQHNILPIAPTGNTFSLSPPKGCFQPTGDYGYYVGSPAVGWNVLGVGAVDERGSLDDTIAPFSNYKDLQPPGYPYGDQNKPDVVAPGVNVNPGFHVAAGLSGTSISAPIVSGIAAQLYARRSGLWLEAARAIIMAGADQDLGTDAATNDKEGIGMVDANWSNRALTGGNTTTGTAGYTYGTLTSSAKTLTRYFSVNANQKVQIALAWSSHTSGSGTSRIDKLTADLDLRVRAPNGSIYKSTSWVNSNEYVEFTSTVTGSVRVDVVADTFTAPYEYYGLAWIRGH